MMRRSTVMARLLPVDVLLHFRQRHAAVEYRWDRNVLHIFGDAHFRGKKPEQRELARHEDEWLWIALALERVFERVFERLLHERGPLRGFLFEKRFASRCRRGAELREPRGES